MICVSYGHTTFSQLMAQLSAAEMAEIRIDLLGFTDEELVKVFQSHRNLIATCRPDVVGVEEQRRLLTLAIDSGAALADIEIEASSELKKNLAATAKAKGCKLIISYHNFSSTPSSKEVEAIIDSIFAEGADIAKVATTANCKEDTARILGLYGKYKNLVAIAMGDDGRIARVAAPLLGAPFTFAAPKGQATAPGQLDTEQMESLYKIIGRDA